MGPRRNEGLWELVRRGGLIYRNARYTPAGVWWANAGSGLRRLWRETRRLHGSVIDGSDEYPEIADAAREAAERIRELAESPAGVTRFQISVLVPPGLGASPADFALRLRQRLKKLCEGTAVSVSAYPEAAHPVSVHCFPVVVREDGDERGKQSAALDHAISAGRDGRDAAEGPLGWL